MPAPYGVEKFKEDFDRLCGALMECHLYVRAMRGLQEGARSSPKSLQGFAGALDSIWSAHFSALISLLGTVLDQSKNVLSIHGLIRDARKLIKGDVDALKKLRSIELAVSRVPDSAIDRLIRWRHEVIAHRTREGYSPEFYANCAVRIDDAEAAIHLIEKALESLAGIGSIIPVLFSLTPADTDVQMQRLLEVTEVGLTTVETQIDRWANGHE